MAKFTINFETDPETRGPWQGRKSAKIKMTQSITDYLTQRCGCDHVDVREVVDPPVVVAAAPTKITGRRKTG